MGKIANIGYTGWMEISNTSCHQELINLHNRARKVAVAKCLLATAAIVAAVATMFFLPSAYLAMGIGVILISSIAIYQTLNGYIHSKNLFMGAARSVKESL